MTRQEVEQVIIANLPDNPTPKVRTVKHREVEYKILDYIDDGLSSVGSGIKGEATPTTMPDGVGVEIYNVATVGTYTNFKDSSNAAIVIAQTDLDSGLVQLWGQDNVWEKRIVPVDLTAYIKEADIVNDLTTGGADKPLSAEQGKAIAEGFSTKGQGITFDIMPQSNNRLDESKSLQGYALNSDGSSSVPATNPEKYAVSDWYEWGVHTQVTVAKNGTSAVYQSFAQYDSNGNLLSFLGGGSVSKTQNIFAGATKFRFCYVIANVNQLNWGASALAFDEFQPDLRYADKDANGNDAVFKSAPPTTISIIESDLAAVPNGEAVLRENSPFDNTATLLHATITKATIIRAVHAVAMVGNLNVNKQYYINALATGWDYGNGLQWHISIRETDTDAVVSRFLTSDDLSTVTGAQLYVCTPLNNSGITTYIVVDFSILPQLANNTFTPTATIIDDKAWETVSLNKIMLFAEQSEDNADQGSVPFYGYSDFGCVDYQDDFAADYIDIISYGQSLSVGARTYLNLTDVAYPGTYMAGDRPMALAEYSNNLAETFAPLKSNSSSWFAEQPVTTATAAFKRMFDRFHRLGYQKNFVGVAAGKGGVSIELLSKSCTNTTSGTTADNYYTLGFLQHLNQAKAAADALSKTISSSAIFYMQGESNYAGTGQGLTTGTDQTTDPSAYKALLLQLKNDMQADVMSVFGQTKKPLFFIYQTGGNWIKNKQQTITQAQIQFADENEDVILMNPVYGLPKVIDYHLTANGTRMYGELVAKAMNNVIIKGVESPVVRHQKVVISGSKVDIYYQVPVLPLLIDTYTVEEKDAYGYSVYQNGSAVGIIDVSVDGNRITLTTASDLSGQIEVTYADNSKNGVGNIRDSDRYKSLYTYQDDSTATDQPIYQPKDINGNSLLGKTYPNYNWASHMYYIETV